jgi:iron complex outermembrane receptor protein
MKRIALATAIAALPFAVQSADTTLSTVVVTSDKDSSATRIETKDMQPLRATTSDTASLLKDVPGVSLYGAGGTSSLPVIHGLADDRLRIKVDGMDLIASCPNHMNPALSYIDPTHVGALRVYAGITPVSVGGDSIGGTIVAETPAPVFAAPGQGNLIQGEAGAFYRSNGHGKGANLSATYATESMSLSYAGATAKSDNYQAGGKFKNFSATGNGSQTLPRDEVGASAYETRNHTLGLALKGGNHLVEAKLGYQDVPYQYYPNQRMDMLDNTQHRLNLRYLGQFDWGSFEARAYHENVDHYMDFGADKQFLYTAGNTTQGMPMSTRGKTTGVSAKASINLSAQDLLRIGGDYQRYRLEDWWPAVVGSMGMGPNDFININDGQRDRTAVFGEWEKRFSPQWLTLLGLRYEQVRTDAGRVHGYNSATAPTAGAGGMMNQTTDAVALNTADRSQSDNNWDMTALARYTANANYDIEFGFARKVRSPNLYERYTWSTAGMMSIMNNTVGDGNGYVGDPDLKPEKAHTLSATFDWHAADRAWEFKATPYYTRVTDYIDAVRLPSSVSMMGVSDNNSTGTTQFVRLRYANQAARLYGLDLSGRLPLAKTGVGEFALKGLLNFTDGKNRDTGDDLYNIMPLNAKLTLTHKVAAWDNAVELLMVKGKNDTNAVRNEIETGGYSLVNLRASYSWKQARLDFGIENLFDKRYELPLGGAYTGQGTTMGINSTPWGIAVPGMGRSLYTGLNVKF